MRVLVVALSVALLSACATGTSVAWNRWERSEWQPRQRLGAPHTIVVIRCA